MATSQAAAALGVETGDLSQDYAADVLLVDGDPVSDLAAIGRTQLVIAGGRVTRLSNG